MTSDNDGLLEDETRARTGSAVFVSIAAALGGFLFGYDTAVINGTVEALEAQWGIGSVGTGVVVSSALLGCAVGAWFAGSLANRLGRPRVMMIAAILFFISALGSALATGPVDLTVWRVCGGLAIGAASVIAPAYIAEIAPAGLRGRLGSLQQFAIVLGIFSALLVNFAVQAVSGGASGEAPWGGTAWRWMFAAEAVPAFVYFMFSLHIPESPRYLVARRELESAKAILAKYVGGDVDAKVVEIQESLHSDKPPKISDVRGPRFGLLPIVWVGIFLSMFQQFVGINVIFYYSTSLWQTVGFNENDAFLTSVINSVVNIAGTVLAIYLVDRAGRKKLLITGSAIMFVALGTMSAVFAAAPVDAENNPLLSDAAGVVALIAANVFVFGFAFTWGPVVWVLLGEMFPNRIRASALGVAAAAQWISNWLITVTFPELARTGLFLAYGLYAMFALISLFFVVKMIPETKGVELEDMEALRSGKVKA
ncbi:sugar porter family MFS transporter [Glycomyces sp. TRM65418]|uniref:sugar porter family MFS transporter n=1 Tax=Glycomyces sp. TRM65418 TaxID=2867006 RepID=UPI001CE6B125|nr:sugar porter family MFS transporter [Glycomyces sp. TRM65418]MCC3763013.1 sugar porter family MFS transporter [Glycomyces sp. TRM65418]QZD57029.1 sugar porter family MFS transporter [Glycomyces sp. TRM65418]